MIEIVQCLTSKLLYNLIKSPVKQVVLEWIKVCLEANRNKAKLVASFVSGSGSSDGFMLNLAGVLLKLCTPFLGPLNTKLSTVDVRFCGPQSNSLFSQPQEDKILDKIGDVEITKEMLSELEVPEQFNFITTCFYVTHRALQLAYISPFDKYKRLMKSLMETQGLIQDMGSSPLNNDGSVRERFESLFVEQLEVKTHLLHPDSITRVLMFYTTSANWLSQLSTSTNQITVADISAVLSIPETPSKTMAMIPSYFISAACQFLINVRYFAEVSLEEFHSMDYLVTFLVLFCNKAWVPNPHIRAEIIEALTVFIPNERSKSSIPTTNR